MRVVDLNADREASALAQRRRAAKLTKALMKLDWWERQAFLLRRYDGLTDRQIGKELQRSAKEIRKALASANRLTAGLFIGLRVAR